MQGLCSQSAHLWATADFVPCSKALGTRQTAGLCSQIAHLWGIAHFITHSKVLGASHTVGFM